jgi:uncharacterized protein
MRISNRTRNTLLGTRVKPAATFWSRLRGYIGRPRPQRGDGILLVPCDAIHTWWMSFHLDVLFLDPRGMVVEVVRSLGPWRRTRRVEGARYVLELPVGTIDASGTQVGDHLTWHAQEPYRLSVLSPGTGERDRATPVRRSPNP